MTRELADSGSKKRNAGARAVRLASLDEAFEKYSTPMGNREFIRALYNATDVDQIVGYGDYFQFKRRGPNPAQDIHPGYGNGYRDEHDVARRVSDDVPRWQSRRFHGALGIDLPVDGGAATRRIPASKRTPAGPKAPKEPRAPKAPKRVPGSSAPAVASVKAAPAPEKPKPICMECFLELPSSGICSCQA